MDIFIAFYLGLYFVNIKDAGIIICSNDTDYDQLIKHLNSNGISIKRVNCQDIIGIEPRAEITETEKKAPKKAVPKKQKLLKPMLKKMVQTCKRSLII